MSELEPRSRFFTSDQQYDFLPTTPPLDDLMYTDQLISNPSPKFRQRSCEEANSFPAIQSRDHSHTATPTISYPCVAWGCSDFSTTGNGLLDTIGTGFTNFTGFATPFPPANDFQSWITQQPPGVDDWGSILDPRFVPELDINPARSIDDLSFDTSLHNCVDHLVEEVSSEPLDTLPTLPRGTDHPTAVHNFLQRGNRIYCQQCNSQFFTRALLESHSRETQHAPYRCRCGTTFSRLDVLRRHIQTFQPEISYPCPHCKKRRGSKAFVRLDHLTQHLRGYHNMESGDDSEETESQQAPRKRKAAFKCPHETCSYTTRMSLEPDQQPPPVVMSRIFQTRGEFTKHLREVHDESIFSCVEIGCSRVGGKGFFRKKDLLKHVKDHHSSAEFQLSAS